VARKRAIGHGGLGAAKSSGFHAKNDQALSVDHLLRWLAEALGEPEAKAQPEPREAAVAGR
jgi:hypothetical protein